MTVAELILELQYQKPDLEVVIVVNGEEYRQIEVETAGPEYAEPFVSIYADKV